MAKIRLGDSDAQDTRPHPLLFDLVEDRVRSKALTACIFLLLFSLLSVVVLGDAMHDPYNRVSSTAAVDRLEIVSSPATVAFSGREFGFQPAVKARSFLGDPVEGTAVRVLATGPSVDWSPLLMSPVVPDGAWANKYEALGRPTLSGTTTAASSASGAAFFWDLALNGQPAETTLSFTAEGVDDPPTATVKFTSDVSDVAVEGETDPDDSPYDTVNVPLLTQPSIYVYDSDGNPLADRYCSVASTPFSVTDSMLFTKLSLFSSDVLGPSDADGHIATTDFAVNAFNDELIIPVINCEGVFNTLPTVRVESNVASVAWVSEAPASVQEGEAFSLSVRVLDASGDPVEGSTAIAMMTKENGMLYTLPKSEFVTDLEGDQHGSDGCISCLSVGNWISKRLQNVYSAPSDADGLAVFEDLRFSVEGPSSGAFRFRVFVDGVATAEETADITVTSTVASVRVFDGDDVAVRFDHCPADVQTKCWGRVTSSTPYLFVADALGNPVPGKTATVANVDGGQAVAGGWLYDGQYSNDAGMLELDNMYMTTGGNASYEVEVVVDGVASASLSVDVTNLAGPDCGCASSIVEYGDMHIDVQVGEVMEGFNMLVSNSWAQPLPNVTVYALATKDFGLTSQPITTTNADGFASFDTVGPLYAAGGTNFVFFVTYDVPAAVAGQADVWAAQGPQIVIDVTNPITAVTVVEVAETVSPPGAPLDPQPRLAVEGLADGDWALATLIVVDFPYYITAAMPFMVAGTECNSFLDNTLGSLCRVENTPYFLDNVQVNVTVVDGEIAWTDLAFNPGFVGSFMLGFYVNGFIADRITVVSEQTVATLEIAVEPGYNGSSLLVGTAFETQPVLRVLDDNGDPVEGFSVSVVAIDPATDAVADGVIMWSYVEWENIWVGGSETEGVWMQGSARSDANGYANFTSLFTISQAADQQDYFLRFFVFNAGADEYILDSATVDSSVLVTSKHIVESVTVVTAPSRYATFGTVMPTQPVVDVKLVADADASLLTALGVTPVITGVPISLAWDVTSVATASGDGSVNGEGRAYFAGFGIDCAVNTFGASNNDVVAGYYDVQFSVLGFYSDPVSSELLNSPEQINILEQPPASGAVLSLFDSAATVQLLLGNGSPLVGITVRAYIVDDAGAGALDASSASAETDEDGVATFQLRLTSGLTGNYSFEFVSEGGFSSLATDPVFVTNPVGSVTAVAAPSEATIHVPLGSSPVARVLDADGGPMANLQVSLTFEDWVNLRPGDGDMLVATTDADGNAAFPGVEFVSGDSGAYCMLFSATGVLSDSVPLEVTNPYEYDDSKIGDWTTFMYCAAVLGVPLFAGNAEGWQNRRVERMFGLFGFAWSLLFVAFAITQLVLFSEYVDEVYSYVDPFGLLLNLGFLAAAVAVSGLSLWVLLRGHSGGRTPHESKLERSDSLVRRLLPRGAAARRATALRRRAQLAIAAGVRCVNLHPETHREVAERVANELIGHLEEGGRSWQTNPAAVVGGDVERGGGGGADFEAVVQEVLQTFEALKSQFTPGVANVRRTDAPEQAGAQAVKPSVRRTLIVAIRRARNSLQPPISKWAAFEQDEDFEYPSRIVVACALSALFVGVTSLVLGLLLRAAQYQVDGVFDQVQLLQLNAADSLRLQASRLGATASVIEYASTGYTSVASVADQFAVAASALPGVADMLSGFDSIAGINYVDLQQRLKDCILGAGVAAIVCAALLVGVVWRFMLRQYRDNILRMRRGEYFFARGKFGVKASVGYIPLQVWHAWLAFVALFSGLFAAFFALSWIDVWFEFVWDLIPLEDILLGLVGVSLAAVVVQAVLLGKVATSGDHINNRYVYSVMDAVMLVLNFGAGIGKAVARWIASLVLSLVFFVRLDVCQMPGPIAFMDPGYHAYVSLALIDHQANNPIVVALCSRLAAEMNAKRALAKQVEGGVQLEARARRRRVVARYWLFLTLANNPQLVLQRGYQLQAKSLSNVYNVVGGAGAALAGVDL